MSLAQPVLDPDTDPDLYGLIRGAIELRSQILAVYHGYYREMCPHAIGINKNGQAVALFYQFAGESESGLGPPGSGDNWRCIILAELSDVRPRTGKWHTASDHSRHQTCVFQRVDLSIAA